MSRRGRSTLSVQLFPFLAVLVCVMGALIFLLLVTSRRMRDVAIARALAELPVASIGDPPPVAPQSDSVPKTAEEPAPDPEAEALASRRLELLTEITDLTAARERHAAALEQQQLLADDAQRRVEALKQELTRAEQQLGTLTGQMAATKLSHPDADAERRRLEQLILRFRRQIKEIEDRQRASEGKFAFVPFDGKSGTTRHPILIECTDSGFRFLPEDVVVRPSDIEGFTEQYNPLLAGAAALSGYWNQQGASGDPSSEPYVLLVVRPSGTLAYYVSQRLLSRLKTPFGYELVTDDFELQLPLVDPGAKAACEAAVKKVLGERAQIVASVTPPRGAGTVPRGNAEASKTGAERSRNGFELADLDVQDGVGERSWEKVDRFDGQEHRSARPSNAAAAEQGEGGPGRASSPAPAAPSRDSSAGTAPHADDARGAVTTADFNDGQYPSFAAQRKSRSNERTVPYEQLQRRKWGRYAAGATIGLEHEVIVRVDAQRMIVDDAIAIPAPGGLSRNDLFDRLLSVVDRQAHTWGQAPSGFFWIPNLKFVISPGGNQVYERVLPLLKKSGLSSSAEFTLDETAPARR
jgi:hypothetical protein